MGPALMGKKNWPLWHISILYHIKAGTNAFNITFNIVFNIVESCWKLLKFVGQTDKTCHSTSFNIFQHVSTYFNTCGQTHSTCWVQQCWLMLNAMLYGFVPAFRLKLKEFFDSNQWRGGGGARRARAPLAVDFGGRWIEYESWSFKYGL